MRLGSRAAALAIATAILCAPAMAQGGPRGVDILPKSLMHLFGGGR